MIQIQACFYIYSLKLCSRLILLWVKEEKRAHAQIMISVT